MADITKPILLDETGQAIKDALLGIKEAVENQGGGTLPSENYYTKAEIDQMVQELVEGVDNALSNVASQIYVDETIAAEIAKLPTVEELVAAVLAALPNGDGVSY